RTRRPGPAARPGPGSTPHRPPGRSRPPAPDGRRAAPSRWGHLQATLEHGALDAVPQAGAPLDQCRRLAVRGAGGELRAGPHRLGIPLHDRVLRAELGHQHGGAAAVTPHPPVTDMPLVGTARLERAARPAWAALPERTTRLARARHGQWASARVARFAATSASQPSTARVVSTSNS